MIGSFHDFFVEIGLIALIIRCRQTIVVQVVGVVIVMLVTGDRVDSLGDGNHGINIDECNLVAIGFNSLSTSSSTP